MDPKAVPQSTGHEVTVPAQCVLVVGNPVDGLTFIGPFDDREDAIHQGDDYHHHEHWLVVPLKAPR